MKSEVWVDKEEYQRRRARQDARLAACSSGKASEPTDHIYLEKHGTTNLPKKRKKKEIISAWVSLWMQLSNRWRTKFSKGMELNF